MSDEGQALQGEMDGGTPAPEEHDEQIPEHGEEHGAAGNKAIRIARKLEKEAEALKARVQELEGTKSEYDRLMDRLAEDPDLLQLTLGHADKASLARKWAEVSEEAGTSIRKTAEIKALLTSRDPTDNQKGLEALLSKIEELDGAREKVDQRFTEAQRRQALAARHQWAATQAMQSGASESQARRIAKEFVEDISRHGFRETTEQRDKAFSSIVKDFNLKPAKTDDTTPAPPATSRGKGAPAKKGAATTYDPRADKDARRAYIRSQLSQMQG